VFLDPNSVESFSKLNQIIQPKIAKQMSDIIRTNKEEFLKILYNKNEDRFYIIKAVRR